MRPLRCRYLGRVPYAEALALQDALVACVRRGEAADTMLLLEHPPVITLGRSASPGHVLASERERAAAGVELHEAGRGGDVTFHGPGQLIGYPIVALREERRDAHRYLRALEGGLIDTASAFGVAASRLPGSTGVWIGPLKLAAIGVRIGTGWITSHGFALNVGGDLSGFEMIVPCGIRDKGITSLSAATGAALAPAQVAGATARCVAAALGYEAAWGDAAMAAGSDGALSSRLAAGGRS